MTTILTDSMAHEHMRALQASAVRGRRVGEARAARRAVRRGRRQSAHPRAAAVGHAAARPFTAVHDWLVAGQL
ncbi:hypothetical protein SAMN05443575_1366 [Jatrophihabitans endophyticus]|uniref:Uncharacterized protein n=1 Tax=Jatrophihabitans endophyticus TaxID=1206085 RepID=A0A1M5H1R6_9ACTN|nr:hypothetical protein [Jatrophihabitans endophyticus]SHG09890.1 hypothetical protein SAMN05443575_1366 [Jatrophihabitans endophyticus]